MKPYYLILVFSIGLLLQSCNNADEPSGGVNSGKKAIFVSAEDAASSARASVPAGMCDNFKVNTSLEMKGTRMSVMDGYEVKFKADEWSYVTETQHIVYWNGNADRYLFNAGAPIDSVTSISASEMKLYLENNTRGSVLASTPLEVKNGTAEFGNAVGLRFNYVHSRIRVGFIKNVANETTISDFTLTPANEIASKANATYTYDWTATPPTASASVNVTATSSAAFNYKGVTIPANTETAVLSPTRYYCVPVANNPSNWTISFTCDGEAKSASFINDKAWEIGKEYIYIFSLKDITPKLVYVLSKDTYFDCNDILPGDVLSDADMTE